MANPNAAIEAIVKFINDLFITNPKDEDLKSILTNHQEMAKLIEANKHMKTIESNQESGKQLWLEPDVFAKMKKVIKIVDEIALTHSSGKRSIDEDQSTSNKTQRLQAPGNNTQATVILDGLQVPTENEIGSNPSEDEVHVTDDANRQAQAKLIYSITKPKNIRINSEKLAIPHLYEWEQQPRGFRVYIKGDDYKPGVIFRILRETKHNYGSLVSFHEAPKHAEIVLEDESKRQLMLEIISESNLALVAEASQYRNPVIKFTIDFPVIEKDIPDLLEEIRDFNLKRFKESTFTVFIWYKLRGTPFTVIGVNVDPKIRDYIAGPGNGKFWLRGKHITVQDYFSVLRCFDCGFVGHKKCPGKQRRCLICSGPHNKTQCTANFTKCPACRGNHEAFTLDCKFYREAIQKDMNQVDYVYTHILWDPRF